MKLVQCFVFMFSIIVVTSCDRDSGNPVDPGTSDGYGSVVVTVLDGYGLPYEGVLVHIEPDSIGTSVELETDAEGIARFDSLSAGTYDISFFSGRMVDDTPIIDYLKTDINVSGSVVVPITFKYEAGATGSEFGSIVVKAVDENENPLKGINVDVFTYNKTEHSESTTGVAQLKTDSEGIAYFDSIAPGQYGIGASSWPNDYGMAEIFLRFYNINVSQGETISKSFHFPAGPVDIAVNVELYSNVTPQFENIEIYFPDWDRTISLDDSGNGILQDIVLAGEVRTAFEVICSRNDISRKSHADIETDSDGWPYLYIELKSPPVLEILTPQNYAMLNNNYVLLTGDGFDFEDGELPDTAFTWSSDIDGDLGTGREITPVLSVGKHKITLTVEDSVGKSPAVGISIRVSHFSGQSYFPLPHEGEWKYLHEIPELVVTTDTGETEHWTLDDMTVTSHDITTRTCRMDWTIECDGEKLAYQYTLTDNLEIDGNLFQVTSTDEVLSICEGDNLVRELAIETTYTPYYPLLTDYLDLQASTREEITVTAESTLEYTVTDMGVHTRKHTETVTISYETGSPEDVTTAAGSFATIPFTSTYNGVNRTWWLARGIGIVKMEYDLFGETVTALLYETNMADFAGSAGKRAVSFGGNAPVRIQVGASAGTPDRMREMMWVMRGMCPR